ncbi:amino acid ABC transporter substrate-binding protein [Corticibacter populi]|uniref:Amino acid ABC transporter substrate-binding protein n=1 Tax=Corticibacter populi TaxID=1550736 RepID=A0A3M6QTU7_9BURK|nr:amino acid ABC transporter substrate-binding protein [Corticibacter populi]RMX05902.1 amino acid ABC transporter substrate-binding protein [Corticibacter populi]RZS30778.1 amino acid ABC transporter substrate-binding protein (PAAT family) [Corticibacter populi]
MLKLKSLLLVPAAVLVVACGKSDNAPAQQPAPSQPAPVAEAPAPALPAKIVVGLDDNFPPMGFRDEKNELVGFDIDMAREAAKRMNIEAEFKPIDWSAKEAELNSRRVDVLWNGLTITEERRKNIGFTAPYMENHQIIIVTAASPIDGKADLAGKVVGAQEGSSAVDAIQKDEATAASFKELKTFGDNITALMDLGTGRLDAVVVDEVVGRYYVAKRASEFRVLEDNFGTEDYGVGTRLDDKALLGKLDETLGAMKQDGTAQQISEQWFGANVIK